MSRKTQKFQIDSEVYEITQLGTELGMPLGHRLLKACAPSVRSFVAQIAASDEKTLGKALDEIGEVGVLVRIVEAFEQAPTELLADLAKTFAAVTTVKSATLMLPLEATYDDHFAGRYDHWVKWLFACVKLNFSARFLGSSAGSGASPTPASGTSASA
jgi:hypothetical protein